MLEVYTSKFVFPVELGLGNKTPYMFGSSNSLLSSESDLQIYCYTIVLRHVTKQITAAANPISDSLEKSELLLPNRYGFLLHKPSSTGKK